MKTFYFRLLERNKEQEYYHDFLLEADSHEDAMKRAEKYARNFYCYCDGEREDGFWTFDYGCLACRIEELYEMSEADFIKRILASDKLTKEHIDNINDDYMEEEENG